MRGAIVRAGALEAWHSLALLPPRQRRVLLLLAAIWVLNFFDLESTLIESRRWFFDELNPLAASLLGLPDGFLVGYKAFMVAAGSTILVGLRRHRAAELGCWFLLAVYASVTARWSLYYHYAIAALDDPATNIHPVTGLIVP